MSAPQITLSAQDREILAMTLAGEIDPRRSPYDDPQTLEEMANILAVAVNRYSTGAPAGFGPAYRSRPDGTRTTERMTDYNSIADVALQAPSANSRNREFGQFSAFNPSHVRTTQANYNARPEYFQNVVEQFFSGQLQASIPDATHYHADWMTAWWADDFDKVGTSGAHHFYSDVRDMQRPLGGTRPAYAQLEFNQPAETDQPNPQGDLNAQELANIAPPTPANAAQMAQARTPNVPNPTARPDWAGGMATVAQAPSVEGRDLQGYLGQQMGVSDVDYLRSRIASGAGPHTARRAAELQAETLANFRSASDRLPADNPFRVTSTLKREGQEGRRTHISGGAVDVRSRDLSPFEEAQQVAALADGGFTSIGVYDGTYRDMPVHIHAGLGSTWNSPNSNFHQGTRTDNPYLTGTQPGSGLYNAVDGGFGVSDAWFGPTAPTPTRNAQPRNMGDGSLDAVPGITPRQDPRNITLPVAMPQPSRESMVQNYGQRALQTPPSSLPQVASGSSSNTTARINQGFNDALAPRSMPSAVARVSPQGSFGTSSPQRSPDQFQYATRPTPAPSSRMETRTREVTNPAYAAWESTQRASNQRSPTDFQYAPQGPSMSTMAANYGARALQGADPFASAQPAPPQTITERYQVSVPNPVARPNMAAPTPRGPQFAGVPNPMARPSSLPQRRGSELVQAFEGFNDWVGDRLPTLGGAAIGGALGGPLGALVGGLGGYGMQQVMGNQGGNNGQPMNINPAPAPIQNIDNPSWSNPVFGVSQTVGQGNSAFDSFYDSQYGSGGFAW